MSAQPKWWFKDEVRVHVTFMYPKNEPGRMNRSDYDLWVVEEDKPIRMDEVGELAKNLADYGYDLFAVAWLNLWWYPKSGEPNNTWHSLKRGVGESTMRVVKKQSKVAVRTATPDDLARLEATKKPNLQSWELVEREEMGIEWMRCHAADEAYAVDYAEREELEAWRAHEWVVAQRETGDPADRV